MYGGRKATLQISVEAGDDFAGRLVGGADQQHRVARILKDSLGYAAEQPPTYPGAAMRGKRNQVSRRFSGKLDNLARRFAFERGSEHASDSGGREGIRSVSRR
jgi:hypothetical protein